jgi:hypothetical protein
MGPSIAALIVISVLLTAVVVMFRANQIGATLLANATKANAERVTEIGNTKFEIISVSTSTDWYSQAEDFDPPNAFGCKPIVHGINRTGEITAADPDQCYWFIGTDGEVVDVRLYRSDTRPGSQRLSMDMYDPASDPQVGYGFDYFDSPVDQKLISLTGGSGTYRIKAWSISGGEGHYTLKLVVNNPPAFQPMTCVNYFHIENKGSAVFSDFEKMDVIANLDSNTTTFLTRSGDLLPGLNEWSVSIPATTTIDGIVRNNDVFQQGILNTGEIMELRVNLSGYSDESGTIVVVFPNGVSSTKKFDLLCNN